MTLLQSLGQRARRWLGMSRRYRIGGVELRLPAEHLLPQYQAAFPRYDRFLTHLAAQLSPGDAVVDVGANIGDTLAGMLAGQGALQLLAIEADATFFAWLQANATALRAAHPQARLALLQCLVGGGTQAMALVGDGGTRRAVPATREAGLQPVPLAELLARQDDDFRRHLRLVKSDVDGHDADVIDSALPALHAMRPMVFLECQVADAAACDAHMATVRSLFDAGYAGVQMFDNFGNALLSTTSLSQVRDHVESLLAPRTSASAPHYLDLLVFNAGDEALVARAVRSHLSTPGAH